MRIMRWVLGKLNPLGHCIPKPCTPMPHPIIFSPNPHKAHLHWQKPKSKKPGFFVVGLPFTLPEKPITFGVFGTKSACAKKPESHTCVLVSGAHARLLSTFDRTRVVRITSMRAAVGWFCWRSRTTWPSKTQIIPARLERAFTLAKNQWNFGGVHPPSKNHAAEVSFSIQVFWSV